MQPFVTEQQVRRDTKDQFGSRTGEEIFLENEALMPREETYGIPLLPLPTVVKMVPNAMQIDEAGNEHPEHGIKINQKIWQFSYYQSEHLVCVDPICFCQDGDKGRKCDCPEFSNVQQGEPCIGDECLIWEVQVQPQLNHHWQFDIAMGAVRLLARDCNSASNAAKFIAKLIGRLNSDPEAMLFTGTIADDNTQFNTRGLYIDHARHFHGLDMTLNLLKMMQKLELNTLYMSLADDEGWRIEIDDLPELTAIGSKRCHDVGGNECLPPQLGSGPTQERTVQFLSKTHYREILMYGKELGITIVPLVSGPGHSAAAVAAMESRFRQSADQTYRRRIYKKKIF